MLHFYVPSAVSHEGMPWSGPSTAANQLAGRFRTLVEHLLPEGCRFELTWDHPYRHHQDADLMYFQGYFRAALSGTPRAQAEQWKQQFRQTLSDCIHGGIVNFLLESGTPIHIGAFNLPPSQEPTIAPLLPVTRPRVSGEHNIGRIGPDQAGRLDVADLEHLPPQVAASALAHELTEQRGRQVQHMSFETAHQTALLREMAVMGGERLSDHEQITDGVNFESPPASEWQWWVPFRSRTHNSIAGVIMIMRGGNVQHCDVVQFPTLEAFQRAANAALRAPTRTRTPTPTGARAR